MKAPLGRTTSVSSPELPSEPTNRLPVRDDTEVVRPRQLVISVHDVSPLTWPVVGAMLADLRAWGVGRTSLLVIPDHHGRGRFRDDAVLCRALERLATREGHELVVHGYYHRRPPRASEGGITRWVTGTYTAGEGEFYDLEEVAAAERLERAREDFATLDAPAPVGFIAPAWLLGEAAERAVRSAGFRYTTRLGTVTDYFAAGGRGVTRSQSLVWSPRNAWRRAVSLGWNAALARRLRGRGLLRVGVHPPDRSHPALWRQVERLVRAALRDREAVTYAEFVGGTPRADDLRVIPDPGAMDD